MSPCVKRWILGFCFVLNLGLKLCQPLLQSLQFRRQSADSLLLLFEQIEQLLDPQVSSLKFDSGLVCVHTRIVERLRRETREPLYLAS